MKNVLSFLLAGALTAASLSAQTLAWTKRDPKFTAEISLNAATYGDKYVVLGYRGTSTGAIENHVTTSTDGATWTAQAPVPVDGAIRAITYGGGLYAAPIESTTGTNLVVTSPDAVTWTARATGAGSLAGIAYGSSTGTSGTAPLFVAVGSANGGNNIATSPNGTTWTRVNSGSAVDLRAVVYSKFVFLAMGNSTLLRSSNGTTWSAVTVPNLPAGARFMSLTNDGTQWLLLVNDSTQKPRVYISPDASAWTTAGSAFTVSLFDGGIASNGSLAAVAGSASAPSGGVVFTAPITAGFFASLGSWSSPQVVDAAGFGMRFIAHVNNLWITGGYSNALFTAAGTGGGGGGTTTPAPAITTQPVAQSATVGGSVTFTAAASGTGNSYQWRFNATSIAGATSATYTIPSVTAANAGTYTVVITNAGGSVTSTAATLTVAPAGSGGSSGAYLSNLSIRSNAGSGPQTLIVGVSVGGTGTSGTKNILIRGVGPTLSAFGLTGVLADPQLTVYNGQTIADSNDNWSATATPVATQSSVGAFALTPGSKDAALIGAGVPAGSYSVQITGVGGTTGLALAELYDLTPASSFTATTPRLNNISARTQVGTGGDILITGFNVSGTGTRRLLIRAVGPTLAAFGVTGTLADPQLAVYSGQTVVASNNDWNASDTPVTTQTGAGGFALTPASKDAALIVNLAPGSYTAQVSGVNNTTGVALVEIYELP